MTIADVVKWTKETEASRLFLPSIQRSLVWRNSQIINFWDSLLRGYPAGLMMVHHPKKDGNEGRATDGSKCTVRETDFLLFDGQQRLSAILLGLGEGQLKDRIKLWVDLGATSPAKSGLQFALRISSTGQPFGYDKAAPNNKLPLKLRRDQFANWREKAKETAGPLPNDAFTKVTGSDLIDASSATLPLHEIVNLITSKGIDGAKVAVREMCRSVLNESVEAFIPALHRALGSTILFQTIDTRIIEDEEEYVRFFGRLGQGGTALSNDELTYSIIKHHFPDVHTCIDSIVGGSAGRIASEVNLVLAALRVAKVTAPWDNSNTWEIFGRPHPGFVSRLRGELAGVRVEFLTYISASPEGRLKTLLEKIRIRLVYEQSENWTGLPSILLARLPHELVDVLLLMESIHSADGEPEIPLPSLVLYWLLFISDSEKAANTIFKSFLQNEEWNPCICPKLIRQFEKQGIARRLPTLDKLRLAKQQVLEHKGHKLRAWSERFTVLDSDKEQSTGEALRVLSTHGELIRCALLWVQRGYLADNFKNYDPTSNRDEDLPIDLDHLIPQSKFSADWRKQQENLGFIDEDENFRNLRRLIGNSLGNFRWFDASKNRSRQDDLIEETDGEAHFIENVKEWNRLISAAKWSTDDIEIIQRRIDLRTINIFEKILKEGGVSAFAAPSDANVGESSTAQNEAYLGGEQTSAGQEP